MRIAQVAPLAEAVPPKLYGGTERVISWLTEELVAQGHDVTLFASGDSQTSARLEAPWPKALRLDGTVRDTVALHLLMIEQVCQRAGEFDIVHLHLDHMPFSLMSRQPVPFVTTLHGRLDLPELQPVFDHFGQVPVVSISDSQRAPLPQAHWMQTIHHGLPADLLTPSFEPGGYLAFLGRICPEKGIETAIRIAEAAGLPLRIAAKVDPADVDYFKARVEPLLSRPGISFIGEINEAQKSAFLGGAMGLLMPIDWPEPFGLVMIEAMACGTPVVAFDRGSVPEVIEDGVTGWIVDDEVGAVDAVRCLQRLDRRAIRARFEQRFTAARMARDYVALYKRLATSVRRLKSA